jgi:hypothetical protein
MLVSVFRFKIKYLIFVALLTLKIICCANNCFKREVIRVSLFGFCTQNKNVNHRLQNYFGQ